MTRMMTLNPKDRTMTREGWKAADRWLRTIERKHGATIMANAEKATADLLCFGTTTLPDDPFAPGTVYPGAYDPFFPL